MKDGNMCCGSFKLSDCSSLCSIYPSFIAFIDLARVDDCWLFQACYFIHNPLLTCISSNASRMGKLHGYIPI